MSPTKKQTSLGIVLIAISICLTASRASAGESRWYVEGKVGQANLEAEIDPRFAGLRVDDEVTSAGIEIGYSINRHLSVQAGYRHLGSSPALRPPCEVCTFQERLFIPLEAEISGVSLAAVPRWPIDDRFSLYGKLGVFHWDAEVSTAFDGDHIASETGEELLAAVGAHYGFPSGFGVLLEYEVVSDLFDGANLGFSWRF